MERHEEIKIEIQAGELAELIREKAGLEKDAWGQVKLEAPGASENQSVGWLHATFRKKEGKNGTENKAEIGSD